MRLTINTSLFFRKNHYFTLFSRTNLFFFSLLQTTKMNLKWPTTLQKPCTNCLALTMWTLVNVQTDADDFLGPEITPTTSIINKNVQDRKQKCTILTETKL